MTIRHIIGKKSRETLKSGLTCLWDNVATNTMIKCKRIDPYRSRLMANNVKYSTAAGPYKTKNDVKVPFRMSELSIGNIITHIFHVYKTWVDEVIGYYIIIFHDLMVKLGPEVEFVRQIL